MNKILFPLTLLSGSAGLTTEPVSGFESDLFDTDMGKVRITFIGHGSLMIEFGALVIQIDPVSMEADYSKFPKADIILITHEHQDHYEPRTIESISKPGTDLIVNPEVGKLLNGGNILKNGQTIEIQGISVHAVPAYNTTPEHSRFHPQGRDNGYILNPGGLVIYIAGDTEPIPEMSALKKIDVAFLPVNQPYTMTPKQAVEASLVFNPRILYPYHYGSTKLDGIVKGLKDSGIEVRIKAMQ